jgi:hypothetical protein
MVLAISILAMRELKAGCLIILACIAICIEYNPRFWGEIVQYVGRLFGMSH